MYFLHKINVISFDIKLLRFAHANLEYVEIMIASYFLENLSALMKDMTQTKLGAAIGMPQQTISNWYRRKRIPDEAHIETLATYFKVEPHYFFMKPGTQGELRKLDNSNDFSVLLDDLAEKCLNGIELETYKKEGASEYIRVLRLNYEGNHLLPVGWCLKLNAELNKYTSVDLQAKLKTILAEQELKRVRSS